MSTIESIDLHVRSYRSALESNLEVTINSLTNSHLKMESILHPLGNDPNTLDTSALIYSLLRLPQAIDKTKKIVLGQNPSVFAAAGFKDVTSWTKITTPARRRTCYFHSQSKTLAVFIASVTDVDDLVNLLIAYQTEWNKFHTLLHSYFPKKLEIDKLKNEKWLNDLDSLLIALGPNYLSRLKAIYKTTQNLRLRQLAGSWIDFNKNTQKWYKNIAITVENHFHLSRQNIYFVSSNSHSILNLFTGFIPKNQKRILSILKSEHSDLYKTWQQIQSGESPLHPNDFLYYASHFLLDHPKCCRQYQRYQDRLGIVTIPSSDFLDVNVQIFPIKNLVKSKYLDSRLKINKPSVLKNSNTLIFNIDYPLGFAAYHILKEILENVNQIKGIYILGKSAVLNSEVGDLQIPRLVFDEHTQNTYMFKNCFNSFFPFVNNQGSILTNQKAVSALGTFLENEALIQKYSESNLTVIEMESGPYLGAITEATYDQSHPKSTIVDLNNAPFDLGIINYTSDTPYSRAKNLGAGSLELRGAEPVYLGSLAILQRIINLEESDY